MKSKAFTLVELMVVIAIIAILAVGSITAYDSYLKKARLSKAVQFSAQIGKAMPDQLKGWWNFNEGSGSTISGFDSTNSGTLTNGVWSDDTPYVSGSSIDFNGTSSYALLNLTNHLREQMAVSFWIKPSPLSGSGSVNARYVLNSSRYAGSGQYDGFNIRIQDGMLICNLFSNGYSTITLQGDIPEFDAWTHIAFSLDGDNLDLYINGELVDSGNSTGRQFSTDSTTLNIGRLNYSTPLYYEGFIDEVRIYHNSIQFR